MILFSKLLLIISLSRNQATKPDKHDSRDLTEDNVEAEDIDDDEEDDEGEDEGEKAPVQPFERLSDGLRQEQLSAPASVKQLIVFATCLLRCIETIIDEQKAQYVLRIRTFSC